VGAAGPPRAQVREAQVQGPQDGLGVQHLAQDGGVSARLPRACRAIGDACNRGGGGGGGRPVVFGDEQWELEAELRKMAPPSGHTVLSFRVPCGCPKGRMEVWGAKMVRRIKK
jgi:hypothetical protein